MDQRKGLAMSAAVTLTVAGCAVAIWSNVARWGSKGAAVGKLRPGADAALAPAHVVQVGAPDGETPATAPPAAGTTAPAAAPATSAVVPTMRPAASAAAAGMAAGGEHAGACWTAGTPGRPPTTSTPTSTALRSPWSSMPPPPCTTRGDDGRGGDD